MKVIEQLVEYLSGRSLLTAENCEWLRMQGFLPNAWDVKNEFGFDECEYECDWDPKGLEVIDEEMRQQTLASQVGRRKSSKGTRRQRKSRERVQALARLQRDVDELIRQRESVAPALLCLGRRIDSSVDSWSAAVLALQNCADESLRCAFNASLRADELLLEVLCDLLTLDDFRPLLAALPARLRTVFRSMCNPRSYVPGLAQKRSDKSPLRELAGLLSVQRRLVALLREQLVNNPSRACRRMPVHFKDCYQLGLLLVAASQSCRADVARRVTEGTASENTRLVLCRRNAELESDKDWQQMSERAWHLTAVLFPESTARLLAEWGGEQSLSLNLEEIAPALQPLVIELAELLKLAQRDRK